MEYWDSEVFRKWSNEVNMLAKNRFGYVYGPNETVRPSDSVEFGTSLGVG